MPRAASGSAPAHAHSSASAASTQRRRSTLSAAAKSPGITIFKFSGSPSTAVTGIRAATRSAAASVAARPFRIACAHARLKRLARVAQGVWTDRIEPEAIERVRRFASPPPERSSGAAAPVRAAALATRRTRAGVTRGRPASWTQTSSTRAGRAASALSMPSASVVPPSTITAPTSAGRVATTPRISSRSAARTSTAIAIDGKSARKTAAECPRTGTRASGRSAADSPDPKHAADSPATRTSPCTRPR